MKRYLIICLLTNIVSFVLAAPPNDNCDKAIEVVIPDGGFAFGDFLSDEIDLTEATIQPGEYFAPVLVSAVNDKKSIWYKFTLPTSREIRLELLQPGNLVPTADAGFTTYYTDGCLPGAAESFAAKLTPLNKFGSSYHPCMAQGTYYIQVSCKSSSNGPIYLKMSIGHTFENNTTDNVPYDFAEEAHDFGVLSGSSVSVTHDFGCHSIDNTVEYDCMDEASPEEYNQSSWYVFKTDDYTDIIEFSINAGSGGFKKQNWYYKFYEGNVRTSDPISLSLLDCGKAYSYSTTSAKDILQECFSKPNTTYSMQIIFHQDEQMDNAYVRIYHRGSRPAGATKPVLSDMAATNQVGSLKYSASGEYNYFNDYFSCNSLLSEAGNQCGSVNLADYVYYNNSRDTFQHAVWFSFTIDVISNINITESTPGNPTLLRIFDQAITNNCNDIDLEDDLYAQFIDKGKLSCVPPGDYSMQVLGANNDANNLNTFNYNCLGQYINITFEVTNTEGSSFGLDDGTAADIVNASASNPGPMQNAVRYNMVDDLFACNKTVLPSNACESNRVFNIGDANGDGMADSGKISISNMYYRDGVTYKLYQGDLRQMAIDQNKFSSGEVIANAQDFFIDKCLSTTQSLSTCITPGKYTLVAFGDSTHIGIEEKNMTIIFDVINTKFNSRQNAENLGDITDETTVYSSIDYYSCKNNPTVYDSTSCLVDANKLIYREFYLSRTREASISVPSGQYGNAVLFTGRASDIVQPLKEWEGLNSSNLDWTSCFRSQRTLECDPLTAGWYTVICYLKGNSYDTTVTYSASSTIVGRSNSITISLYDSPSSQFNRPYKASDEGTIDWILSEDGKPTPATATTNTFEAEYFTCLNDLPFSSHPVEVCDTNVNRVAYYVFSTTKEAHVRFNLGLQNGHSATKLYAFDVRTDSMKMVSEQPIYPCVNRDLDLSYCGLPAGTYTLAIFVDDYYIGKSIRPSVLLEKVGTSRFDHQINAYDFGLLKGDNNWYDGKEGDVHPIHSSLAPSNDFYYCTTGAHPDDDIIFCGAYNPNIYNHDPPGVLEFSEDNLTSDANYVRNLWYTFTADGGGVINIEYDVLTPGFPSIYYAGFSIYVYESLGDGNLAFGDFVTQYEDGFTLKDSMKLIANNNTYACYRSYEPFTFGRDRCSDRGTKRYFVLVQRSTRDFSNVQTELKIKYNKVETPEIRYDYISDANVINGLNEVQAPYTNVVLGEGIYMGDSVNLGCASRSPNDPSTIPNRPECHTVWYKFELKNAGLINWMLDNLDNGTASDNEGGLVLFRATSSSDTSNLEYIRSNNYYYDASNNRWGEACYYEGTYYLAINACAGGIDINNNYLPKIRVVEKSGGFCYSAVPVLIDGIGSASGSVNINCHTIGQDFGEDGSNMGCLFGPEDYKSTWFKVTLTGDDKVDLSFNMVENTNRFPNEIRYRVLYGNCSSMTAGPCNTDANTIFTLNCMVKGDYFVQVVSPDNAIGDIELYLSTVITADTSCKPLDPDRPVANFQYRNPCGSDTIYFKNESTRGDSIAYLWDLPKGETSDSLNPFIVIPRNGTLQTFDVSLKVTNVAADVFDKVTIPIQILPTFNVIAEDTLNICGGNPVDIFANYDGATFLWNTGSTDSFITASNSGQYWVEASFANCKVRDEVFVRTGNCDIIERIDTSICKGSNYNGQVFNRDTTFSIKIPVDSETDSIIKYTITVVESIEISKDTLLCSIDGFIVDGTAYFSDTIVCSTYNSIQGCDSIFCWNLTFEKAPDVSSQVEHVICDTLKGKIDVTISGGDSSGRFIEWTDVLGNVLYSNTTSLTNLSSGDYILKISEGICMIEETFHIDSIGCNTFVNIDTSICKGELYAGNVVRNDTLIVDTLVSSSKADSVITININILNVYDINERHVLCIGDTFLLNGSKIFVDTSFCNLYTSVEGCDSNVCVTIDFSDPHIINEQVSLVSCYGQDNGSVNLSIDGGSTPYSISWQSSNGTGIIPNSTSQNSLSPGSYGLKITDGYGCTVEKIYIVTESTPMDFEIIKVDELCDGQSNGSLEVINVNGGTGPYEIKMNNLPISENVLLDELGPGKYFISILDSNDCEIMKEIFINRGEVNRISGNDKYKIELGDSVLSELFIANELASSNWSGDGIIECDTCFNTVFYPVVNTTYNLIAYSKIGCETGYDIFVEVNRNFDHFIPNTFTPNNDGQNDLFFPMLGKGVKGVKEFKVFSRWGQLVYQISNIESVDSERVGWNGMMNGQDMPLDVYIYHTVLELLDGSVVSFKGDITLLR